MFGYRHIYHAGNFADVVKHVVLLSLLRALQRKDTPLYFHDTHAGIGRYDLRSPQAQKKREFEAGIMRLLDAPSPPAEVQDYLDAIRSLNPKGGLRWYPGSPRLAGYALRPQDRMVLTELNPADHDALKNEFTGTRKVEVRLEDAYRGLKAQLPPRERRGLVLIDPPYEGQDEYAHVCAGLQAAHRRWPEGTYAVWYPIMTRSLANRLHQGIVATGIRKILCAELTLRTSADRARMSGSGLLLVNPPWQLPERLPELLEWLWRQLSPEGTGGVSVSWLVEE